jgi:hypothetical protein
MPRPKIMATRKIVSLPPELAEAVEDFRFSRRIGSEAEALRRLIELGLRAAKARARPAKPPEPQRAAKSKQP